MILEAQKISGLIHTCDTDNLITIAKHILGYEILPEENGDAVRLDIVNECDFILENFMPKNRIIKLHEQIFKN